MLLHSAQQLLAVCLESTLLGRGDGTAVAAHLAHQQGLVGCILLQSDALVVERAIWTANSLCTRVGRSEPCVRCDVIGKRFLAYTVSLPLSPARYAWLFLRLRAANSLFGGALSLDAAAATSKASASYRRLQSNRRPSTPQAIAGPLRLPQATTGHHRS